MLITGRSQRSARPLAMSPFRNTRSKPAYVVGAALLCATGPLLGREIMAPDVVKAPELSAADVSQTVIEAPRVFEVALSPNGMLVAYTVVRGNVETNSHRSELLLQALNSQGGARDAPKLLAEAASKTQFRLKWRPDSRILSYYSTQSGTPGPAQGPEGGGDSGSTSGARTDRVLMAYDVQTGTASLFDSRKLSAPPNLSCNVGSCAPQSLTIGSNFRWSPTGRFLAFLSPVGNRTKLDARKGMVQTPELLWKGARREGLYVVEVASGEARQLTPDTMAVHGFAWSPDENELVIRATESRLYRYRSHETLRIVKRSTGAIRTLVSKPGSYVGLAWSPDGKWIAFGEQPRGNELLGHFFPSVVAIDSPSDIIALSSEGDPLMYGDYPTAWTADSSFFYYHSSHHLTGEIAQADIVKRRVATVFPEDTYSDRSLSFSADGQRVAFTRSSLTSPWDLYVTALPNRTPHAITQFESSFALGRTAQIERVSWPSQDGKFTVHGLLTTPKTAWQPDGSAPKAPLPTIVFNQGGPAMVWSGIDTDNYNGLVLTLAARGYAVLSPNTRSRGGYGTEFKRATKAGSAYYRLAYLDMMAGIEMLVKHRRADPQRLGILGHSYGANLTSYAVTQTARFRAGVVHEATRLDILDSVLTIPGSTNADAIEYLMGISDPFSETAQKRLIDESPRFHLGRMTTPLLLQFGAHSQAGKTGEMLYRTMLRLNLPCEFVVYDSGHGVVMPAPAVDEHSRVVAWFDYWLQDLPYPDEDKSREYTTWQTDQRRRNQ